MSLRVWAIVFATLTASAALAAESHWPEFRGSNRDGKSTETGLLQQWPEGGPKLLWSVTGIGKGFTHVSVAEGLVYVTGLVDQTGILHTYTPDGTLEWQADYGEEWYKSSRARSIPTVRDGLLYIASGVGNVFCFDAATGKPVWSVKLSEQYEAQAPQTRWGYAESLFIDGDKVICTPVGKTAAMVALDRKTGKEIWAGPPLPEHKSSFCSPLLVNHNGIRMFVTMTDRAVVAFSPDDGSILWQVAYKSPRGNHPDTPIYHDGFLYVVSGYGKGAMGFELADDGKSVKQIWEQRKQDPVHGQAVLVDGYVYASSHRSTQKWSCVELKTGKLMWEAACSGKGGSIIHADGMLYCYSEDGNVGLVRPNPERCELVSLFKVPLGDGPHWGHPVVSHGRLFIRHGDALMCYDVAAKP